MSVEIGHALRLRDVGPASQIAHHHLIVALEATRGDDDLLGGDGDLGARAVGALDAAGLSGLVEQELGRPGGESLE